MLVKRIAAYTHLSSTVYELQRDIGRKLRFFSYSLTFNAPVGVFPLEFRGISLVLRKLESWGYQAMRTV